MIDKQILEKENEEVEDEENDENRINQGLIPNSKIKK